MEQRTMARKTRKSIKNAQINIDTTEQQIVDMQDEGGMIYGDTPVTATYFPILLASDVLADLDPKTLLGDGKYKNIDGSAGPCVRCNRRIHNNAMYHRVGGHVVGLECMNFISPIRDADPSNWVAIAKQQFRLRMRELTIAGMKKKGLIKDKQVSMPAQDQELIDQLVSMG
jgi:hypothetical protein